MAGPLVGEIIVEPATGDSIVVSLNTTAYTTRDLTATHAFPETITTRTTYFITTLGPVTVSTLRGGTEVASSSGVRTVSLGYGQSVTVTPVASNALNTAELAGLFAGALAPVTAKTSPYTASAGDLIPVDLTSGSVTVTLPTAPADKTRIAVKVIALTGSYTCTVAAGGSDVFNKAGGGANLTLPTNFQAVNLQYKASGAIWYVVGDNLALSQLDARYVSLLAAPSGVAATDLANLQAKIDAAAAAGGGYIYAAAGTYLITEAVLKTNVHLYGAGHNGTTFKLPDNSASGARILVGLNYDALVAAAVAGGGISGHGLHNIAFDGNKANNASGGAGIAWWGYGWTMDNVRVRNCHGIGIVTEWKTASFPSPDGSACFASKMVVTGCDGGGWNWTGPNDSFLSESIIALNGGIGFTNGTNADGLLLHRVHVWGDTHTGGSFVILGTSTELSDCIGAGKGAATIVSIQAGGARIRGGFYFADSTTQSVVGITIGVAATTAVSSCQIDTRINHCGSGAVVFADSSGNNAVKVTGFASSGNAMAGTPHSLDKYDFEFTGGTTMPAPAVILTRTGELAQANNGAIETSFWPSGSMLQPDGALTVSLLIADRATYTPVWNPIQRTISQIMVDVSTVGTAGGGACNIRMGIYTADTSGRPSTLLVDFGLAAFINGTTLGINPQTGLSTVIPAGLLWVCVVGQGSPTIQPTVRTISGTSRFVNLTTYNTSANRSGYAQTGVTGALANASPSTGTLVSTPWVGLVSA